MTIHSDFWIHFKSAHKLKNKDVAKIIGMAESSVRNQTQPNNELPRWAILAIYTWMQNKSN
ncbi:MAG: hypothetical protein H7296_08485 [Bacteroidia bacterium]|nr:hypothetical protein [Bacteroidia bacterium]